MDKPLKAKHEQVIQVWVNNIAKDSKKNKAKQKSTLSMFPKELIELICLFSHRIELEFSEEWRGLDVTTVKPNRVQFAINSGTSHCIALLRDVIDIPEYLARGMHTFAWEFAMHDVCHASWYDREKKKKRKEMMFIAIIIAFKKNYFFIFFGCEMH
ncbi:hypothetical protein RFI_11270 [Reticulomyxa filosa]|uniref:Uncharacterized protein n=1 Tax=Reticulomyxa filosa TaxID=46433 RepID=X6NJJ2_RETFI|nr:hypothetical protein RFI_11270 [Reticulomyxa filosa]|eukprot:ETO25869.1 hypothetical protein RFI_11270 [Reticulomyxa filosa]